MKSINERVDNVIQVLTNKTNIKGLNKTQIFFVNAFKNDLSDKDLKEIKKLIKIYFSNKLKNG